LRDFIRANLTTNLGKNFFDLFGQAYAPLFFGAVDAARFLADSLLDVSAKDILANLVSRVVGLYLSSCSRLVSATVSVYPLKHDCDGKVSIGSVGVAAGLMGVLIVAGHRFVSKTSRRIAGPIANRRFRKRRHFRALQGLVAGGQ